VNPRNIVHVDNPPGSRLPAGADQIPALDSERIFIEDLVRSYRLVSLRTSKIAGDFRRSPKIL
jgi:hypothetical protein